MDRPFGSLEWLDQCRGTNSILGVTPKVTITVLKNLFFLVCVYAAPLAGSIGNAAASENEQGLRYYGHYWVESKPYGSHLDEVASHCNIHWVESIEGLRKCAERKQSCILQIRWEFFSGREAEGQGDNPIRVDHKAFWEKTAKAIMPYIDFVEAFYMIDEPYWVGVSPEDLDTAITAVKHTFCKKPVMVVFAVPSLKPDFVLPAKADWVGFDDYNDMKQVAEHLNFLKSKLHTHQRLFLVPQSFLNTTAKNDESLAQLNWDYYNLARSEPLVIGLLNFGLFTHATASELPLTLEAQREIGGLITGGRSKTQPSSNHVESIPRK